MYIRSNDDTALTPTYFPAPEHVCGIRHIKHNPCVSAKKPTTSTPKPYISVPPFSSYSSILATQLSSSPEHVRDIEEQQKQIPTYLQKNPTYPHHSNVYLLLRIQMHTCTRGKEKKREKRPVYPQKSPIYLPKNPIIPHHIVMYLLLQTQMHTYTKGRKKKMKTGLYIRKRALYIFAKEPYISGSGAFVFLIPAEARELSFS